jgi:hypothetical protein
MKKVFLITGISFCLFFLTKQTAYSWGFYAHKKVNRMAVFTLPPEMIGFYKKHIDFITEHAVDPDKRRYGVDGEAPRHYIDIDIYEHYCKDGEDVFDVVPKKWKDAVEKFSEDTLLAYGIVPWHLEVMVKRLMYAFKDKKLDKILKYSAELGHYIGDSHVPLHTTENYNGQLTNQKGIHGFWESRIPELYSEDYNYFIGKAEYIENTLDFGWDRVLESHRAMDSVLDFERELNERFPQDQKYVYETRGATTVKNYSHEYSKAFSDMLDGQVERRMKRAILSVGSYWYTAWVNAGQPDLGAIDGDDISEGYLKELQEEEKKYKGGKIKGRSHQD